MRNAHGVAVVVVMLGILSLARPAHAQWGGDSWTNSYGNSFNNPTSALMNQFMWDDINKKSIYKPVLKKRGYTDEQLKNMSAHQMEQIILGKGGDASGDASGAAQPAPPQQTAPQYVAGATTFVPTQGRLIVTPLLDQLVTDKAMRTSVGQAAYAAFQGWEALAKRHGLANDVAGATAFLVAASYSVYSGQQVSDAGMLAAATALRVSMSTPQMAQVSSADKQAFYEMMITVGTVLVMFNQQAYNLRDAAGQAAVRRQAGDVLRGFLKLDPDSFVLTDQGFAPVQRSSR